MKYTFHTCDVFTDVRFGGNPLAVVLNADGLTTEQMQIVAREYNLSETVFICAAQDDANTARLRIFTPTKEMPFAGHPTVGAACMIARLQHGEGEFEVELVLEENAGLVPVSVSSAEGGISAQLASPGLPKIGERELDHAKIARGLSLGTDDIGFDGHKAQIVFSSGNTWLFVPVRDLAALSSIPGNNTISAEMEDSIGLVSTVVYSRQGVDKGTDFSVRMFSAGDGISEDPATGSAAATFPGQIVEFETLGEGAHKWCLEQGYDMGRPSKLFLEADRQDNHFTQIRVGGSTVFVSNGEIEI